jgi:hypothetical protein
VAELDEVLQRPWEPCQVEKWELRHRDRPNPHATAGAEPGARPRARHRPGLVKADVATRSSPAGELVLHGPLGMPGAVKGSLRRPAAALDRPSLRP